MIVEYDAEQEKWQT